MDFWTVFRSSRKRTLLNREWPQKLVLTVSFDRLKLSGRVLPNSKMLWAHSVAESIGKHEG